MITINLSLVFLISLVTNIITIFVIKVKSINSLAILTNLTAGILTGIICFEMIPDSIILSNYIFTILICFLTVILTFILDKYVTKNNSTYLITLSMFIHNIIEGIAVGSVFTYSYELGVSLLIATILHDIPESLIIGVNILNKRRYIKLINALLISFSLVIGMVIGKYLGNISNIYSALFLSLSSGCMLYIVVLDLLPKTHKLSNNKYISIIYIIGLLISIVITHI
ncbi:MAG: ZIP family metal transporter [Clostridia bacterium]